MRGAARATGPERVTTLEAVLDVAGRLLDEEGLDAFSMRRLAQELGVSSMTVYGYVDSKDELLDAIAARVLGRLGEIGDSLDWQARMATVVIELRSLLRKHPGVAEIVTSRPSPAMDHFRELMLAVLEDVGFEEQDAIDLPILLSCYAVGYTQTEVLRAGTDPEVETDRLRRLPADEFPHLTAAAEKYSRSLGSDAFELGLRSLIRGFAEERLTTENGGS